MPFQLSESSEKIEALVRDARETFQKYEDLGLPMEALEALPSTDEKEDGAIKLVFVGQYSAGKSSIIKMLTGMDTGIGADIKTDHAQAYPWHGIEIVDTPGIQTGIREDHDAITYEQIKHADLLIFTITNEGFDQTMGNHFQKLAVEQQRGANMILVINKMDRAALGNSPEQQQVMLPDIEKVIAPFTPEQLYTSFVSTNRYEESLEETEAEVKQDLLEESGYDVFIDHLNDFVEAKGLTARLQKPLNELAAALEEAGKQTGADDAACEIQKRQIRTLKDNQAQCMDEMQDLAMMVQSSIKGTGRKASLDIQNSSSREEAEEKLSHAISDVEAQVKDCQQKMVQAAERMGRQIEQEDEALMQTDFAQSLRESLQAPQQGKALQEISHSEHLASADAPEESSVDMQKVMTNGAGALSNLGGVATSSLKSFSGSLTHTAVKEVGHLFGASFKPWQALNIAKGLSIFGAALGALGVVYEIYKAVTEGEKVKDRETKMREARQEIQQKFNEDADAVYSDCIRVAHEVMDAWIQPAIEGLQTAIREAEEQQQARQAFQDAVRKLEDRTYALREQVQTTNPLT